MENCLFFNKCKHLSLLKLSGDDLLKVVEKMQGMVKDYIERGYYE